MKSKAAQILQEKNQRFLDDVKDILGDDWTIKCQVDDLSFTTSHRGGELKSNSFTQFISFRRKLSNGEIGSTLQVDGEAYFSTEVSGSLQLNDEVFDRLLDGMDRSKRIPPDAYTALKGRKNIELANDLLTSLTQNSGAKPTKKLKL